MKKRKINLLISAIGLGFISMSIYSCAVDSNMSNNYDDIYLDDGEIQIADQMYYGNNNVVAEVSEHNYNANNQNLYQDSRYQEQTTKISEPLHEQYSDNNNSDSDPAFDMDDYYDYAYTARIHRFHRPVLICDYYDDYYTNLYWYDRNFMDWGVSIYLGYNWWWPSFGIYYGWGYYPWYGYGWAYGYGHHHWHNHWYNPHYYNSFDHNSNFYRPNDGSGRMARANNPLSRPGYRGEPNNNKGMGSAHSSLSRANNTDNSVSSFGQKYNQRYGNSMTTQSNKLNRNTSNRTNSSSLSRSTNSSSSISSSSNTSNRLQRPNSSNTITRGSVNNRPNTSANSKNNLNRVPNTVNRSNNSANLNRTTTRSYTPPTARQQRTTNLYRTNKPTQNTSRKLNSTPSMSRPTISSPSRSSSPSSGTRSSGSRSSSRGGGRMHR